MLHPSALHDSTLSLGPLITRAFVRKGTGPELLEQRGLEPRQREERPLTLNPGLLVPTPAAPVEGSPNSPVPSVLPDLPHRTGELRVEVARSRAEIDAVLPMWSALASQHGATPLADPHLQLAWADTYLDETPVVITVHSDRGLEAAAAVWSRGSVLGGGGRTWHLAGGGHESGIFERPEIVTRPGTARRAVALILVTLGGEVAGGQGWSVISLDPAQGWLEPGSLADEKLIAIQKGSRASVVAPLRREDWDRPLPRVKRNLRESLRRARNRLDASGHPWSVTVSDRDSTDFDDAAADLARLHHERSTMDRPVHPDVLAEPSRSIPLIQAMNQARGAARPQIWRLFMEDRAIAALLVIRDQRKIWISVSGMDAEGWHVSAVTWLQAQAIRRAALDGAGEAIFSVGLDTAKLRWSEQIRTQQDFVLVSAARRTRLLFPLYWQLRAFGQWRRAHALASR